MKPGLIYKIVSKLGLYSTRKDNEEYIFFCPVCGRKKLEVNFKKMIFHCFRCDWRGTVAKLINHLKIEADIKYVEHIAKTETNYNKEHIPVTFFYSDKLRKYLEDRGVHTDRALSQKWGCVLSYNLRGRVKIPIIENREEVCYVLRSYTGQEPKELSPPAKVARRSDFVYNIDEVERASRVVITEGIFDCEMVRKAGYTAVSILGSSISDIQVGKLLAKHPGGIITLLDGDEAGKKGSMAVLRAFTKRFEGSIRVVNCPEGKDPAELGAQGIRGLLG